MGSDMQVHLTPVDSKGKPKPEFTRGLDCCGKYRERAFEPSMLQQAVRNSLVHDLNRHSVAALRAPDTRVRAFLTALCVSVAQPAIAAEPRNLIPKPSRGRKTFLQRVIDIAEALVVEGRCHDDALLTKEKRALMNRLNDND